MNQSTITRRKSSKSPSPRPEDRFAWRHDNGAKPVLLLRSPLGDGVWLIREEFDCLVNDARTNRRYAFRHPVGNALLKDPKSGDIGYFEDEGYGRRAYLMTNSWRMDVCHYPSGRIGRPNNPRWDEIRAPYSAR